MVPSKGMLPVLILDILRKYTDEDHTVNQNKILEYLKNDYGLEVERKAIRRNIEELVRADYPIEYTETPREGNTVWSEFWMRRDFTDAELRLMIDSILFSNHIPHRQRQALVKKIEGLSSENFEAHVKHIATLPDSGGDNKQIFYNVAILDEAISRDKQVAFSYVYYGTDKKNHPKLNEDGSVHEYIINPYQMAAHDGKYYLICNYERYDDVSNYRIDRIADIRILDTKRKPFAKLKGSNGQRFELGEYMKEHIYMHHGGNTRVRFKAVRAMISDIVDTFGKEAMFEKETEDYVVVSAKVNAEAMIRFAQSCAPDVVILEPENMVKKMKEWAEKVSKVYGG